MDDINEVRKTLSAINDAWRNNNPEDLIDFFHQDIVMKMPGFKGEVIGRKALVDSFVEFCTNADILEYSESDVQINVIGNSAVAAFKFDMIYKREKFRIRSKGRDFWIFEKINSGWVAIWRTITELEEKRLQETDE